LESSVAGVACASRRRIYAVSRPLAHYLGLTERHAGRAALPLTPPPHVSVVSAGVCFATQSRAAEQEQEQEQVSSSSAAWQGWVLTDVGRELVAAAGNPKP